MSVGYNVSTYPQMAANSVVWGGPPNLSYASALLEQQPHNGFTEASGMGTQARYANLGQFHHGRPYGMNISGLVSPAQQQQQAQTTDLPHPHHILPSQGTPKACLACGKLECSLVSHKHFSQHMLTTSKDRHALAIRTNQHPGIGQPVPSPVNTRLSDNLMQYPMVMDPERQQLLALWSREWSRLGHGPERHLFPVRFVDRVLPAAKSHAPLLQSLLALSANLWAQANDVVDEIAGRHLAIATQMLSQACPNEETASTDESMLAAILILLVYLAQGNGFEIGKHISGLVHLASLRGGLHYLGMSGLVAEMLMYADHMQAIFFDREVVWKLPMPPLEVGLTPRFGRGFHSLMNSNEIDVPLLLAGGSLCRATDIFQHASSSNEPLASDSKNAFGYLSTIAEFQLAQCNARYHKSSPHNESLCLAMILYNLLILRNEGSITPTIRKVEYRLWNVLETTGAFKDLSKKMPRLLLWILVTGLTVSIRGECQWRTAALGKIRLARMNAAIKSWDQFQAEVLDRFLWFAPAQEEIFRRLWLDIDGLKTKSASKG